MKSLHIILHALFLVFILSFTTSIYQAPTLLGSTDTVRCRVSTLAGEPTKRSLCSQLWLFLPLTQVSWALVASGSLIIS